MNRVSYFVMLMLVMLAFAGCSSKGGEKEGEGTRVTIPPIIEDSGMGGSTRDAGGFDGSQAGGGIEEQPGSHSPGAPAERIIYFDFDKSDIRGDARSVLERNAAYLTSNPSTPIRLEGHADERGAREYNLGLGERRAESIKRTLGIMGIPEQQVTTLSYGEERPANPGHSENAWQHNRRVEIIYP